MQAAPWLLAALAVSRLAGAEQAGKGVAPAYSAASLVNSANNLAGALAPNTIVTLYGENLAYQTRAVSPGDLSQGRLPTTLVGTGVRVLVQNIPAGIYYVSPNQINLLIPGELLPGPARLQVIQDGRAGPEVQIRLRRAAPALYQLDADTAIAVRAGGALATAEAPARPGEVIVLYATGLGEVVPPLAAGEIPRGAASLKRLSEFAVFLDGLAVEASNILYAGVTPGFAGLYQINLRLPATTGRNPEVRLAVGEECSPPGVRLAVEPN
jgi:uncharacterized protein (TIGR03437 family)